MSNFTCHCHHFWQPRSQTQLWMSHHDGVKVMGKHPHRELQMDHVIEHKAWESLHSWKAEWKTVLSGIISTVCERQSVLRRRHPSPLFQIDFTLCPDHKELHQQVSLLCDFWFDLVGDGNGRKQEHRRTYHRRVYSLTPHQALPRASSRSSHLSRETERSCQVSSSCVLLTSW